MKTNHVIYKAHAKVGIIVLFFAEALEVSTFSFSSTSGTLLGAGLALIIPLPTFAFCDGVCCCSSRSTTDDTLRCGTGVTLCGVALAEDDRPSPKAPRPAGVGVLAIDERGFSAGGPMDPSTLARPEGPAGLVAEAD
jgi:hypothetical protein